MDHWLLIRGLAREQRHWGELPKLFERDLDARVHTLDLPGMGTERARRSPVSVRAIAADMRARWMRLRDDDKRRDARWLVFSISLGGMVAMDWTSRHDDFAGAVLTNSSARGLGTPFERMNWRAARDVVTSALDRDDVARERRILAMTTNMKTDHELDALAAEWAAYARDRTPARANLARQLLAASRFRAPSHIATRLLVLTSTRDRLASTICSRRIAEHFHAPIETHARAGHDLPNDDPAWVIDRVRAWLSRVSTSECARDT